MGIPHRGLDPEQGAPRRRAPRLPAMRVLRRHRGWLSGWLLALLLLSLSVTTAHACLQHPGAGGGDAAESVVAAVAPDCDMAAMGEQTEVCKAHCETGKTPVSSQTSLPDVLSSPVGCAAWVGSVDWHARARLAARPPAAAADGPPTGTLPLYLSLLVLRN